MVEQQKDPEIAEAILDRREERKKKGLAATPYRPSPYEWGLPAILLKAILDRLGELVAVEGSQPLPKGVKMKKPPKAFPVPQTAIEKAEFARRVAYFESIDAEVQEAQERYRREHPSES